jgi:hypothetical protein
MGRDARLDLFRGVALMMIFINHMPGNVLSYFTLQNLGLSDAAEVFVLTAGMSAYFAFSHVFAREPFFTAVARVVKRVRRLYVTHLVLFLLVTSVAAWASVRFADRMYLEAMALDFLVQDPWWAILRVVTLSYLPPHLDILPLYVVLIASVPLCMLLFRRGAFAPLAVSLGVYALAHWLGINLPNAPESRSWFFNPFAWQFLFVIGMTVAHMHRLHRLCLPASGAVTLAASAYLVFAFIAAAPWTDIPYLANAGLLPHGFLPPIDKTNLSLLRLCNVLAQAWIASTLLSSASPLLKTRPARAMILAGRNSLNVFALGVVLSTVGSILLKETRYDLAIQIAYVVCGILVMVMYAGQIELRKAGRQPAGSATRRPDRMSAIGAQASIER